MPITTMTCGDMMLKRGCGGGWVDHQLPIMLGDTMLVLDLPFPLEGRVQPLGLTRKVFFGSLVVVDFLHQVLVSTANNKGGEG
jgi:hypothetical protein